MKKRKQHLERQEKVRKKGKNTRRTRNIVGQKLH